MSQLCYHDDTSTLRYSLRLTCGITSETQMVTPLPSQFLVAFSAPTIELRYWLFVQLQSTCWRVEKNPPPVPELIIDVVAFERVAEYRYLGTVLDNNLTFDRNVDTIHKKCQSRIYCLQKLRNIGVPSGILEMYCRACIQSVLTLSFMCWYGSLGVRGKKVLNDVVNVCNKVVLKKQACMQDL